MEEEKITFETFARLHLLAVSIFLLLYFLGPTNIERDLAISLFIGWIFVATIICFFSANLFKAAIRQLKALKVELQTKGGKFLWFFAVPLFGLLFCFMIYSAIIQNIWMVLLSIALWFVAIPIIVINFSKIK